MVNEIPISVVDRKIKVGRHVPATMTNIGKDYLSISLDDEWSSMNHRLRVTLYSEAPYVSVQDWWDGRSAIEIPQEITSCPAFKVTVALISEDGYERLVTQSMDEPIENPRNGHDEGSEPGVRTMDIIARIDALAADLEEKRDTDYWRGPQGKPGKDADIAGAETAKDAANKAAKAAIDAAARADSATSNANNAANVATEAATLANEAADNASNASSLANESATIANNAAANANEAATLANNAATNANEATESANNAATNANESATNADTAATNANAAATEAHGAATNANEAAVNANNAADRVSAYTEIIEQNKKRITSLEVTVSKQGKQIANLQGIAATEETDSTEAYAKTVPTGAQKWASLDKVGGKTVVWNNVYNHDMFTGVERNGCKYVKTGGTSFSVVGMAVGGFSYVALRVDNVVKDHLYYLKSCPAGGSYETFRAYLITDVSLMTPIGEDIGNGAIYKFNGNSNNNFNCVPIYVNEGTSVNFGSIVPYVIDLTLLFGIGNEPTSLDDPRIAFIKAYAEEHPEYNPGELMSAEVVEVESRGKNLWNPLEYSEKMEYVYEPRMNPDGSYHFETEPTANSRRINYVIDVRPGVQHRIICGTRVASGVGASQAFSTCIVYDGESSDDALLLNGVSFGTESGAKLFTPTSSRVLVSVALSGGSGGATVDVYSPQIWETSDNSSYNNYPEPKPYYTPYRDHISFPIPNEVREMCPGYGWSAGTVCNEIDFGRKVYVQRVGSVDLGTLAWSFNNIYKFFIASATDKKPGAYNMLTSFGVLDAINIWKIQFTGDIYCGNQSNQAIYFKTSNTMTVQEFKQAMSGVLLYYELAEPIEVDLSNVLPDDNFIEVEAGGTVTFKQASTQLPVPSSVTYQISTSEVIANA